MAEVQPYAVELLLLGCEELLVDVCIVVEAFEEDIAHEQVCPWGLHSEAVSVGGSWQGCQQQPCLSANIHCCCSEFFCLTGTVKTNSAPEV